jgi:hypothetical protein
MDPSNLHTFTQKQIQDANVIMGEARCANESRAKSEAKFIAAWTMRHSCSFILDGIEYQLPIPAGKSREDLVKHVLQFFATG